MYRIQKSEIEGAYPIKKVCAFLAEGTAIFIGSAMIYYPFVMFRKHEAINIGVLGVYVIFLVFAICKLKSCFYYITTPYLCVPEISRHINRKDLKKMIETEKFISETGDQLQNLMKLSISDHWLYIQGIYLPKNMILGFWQFYTGPSGPMRTKKIVFLLCTGKKVVVDTHIFLQNLQPEIKSSFFEFLKMNIYGTEIFSGFENDRRFKTWQKEQKEEFKKYISGGGKIEDIITNKIVWKQEYFISQIPNFYKA